MTTERDDKRGGSVWAIGCLLMICVLLPTYVLSIGPVVWFIDRNPDWEPLGLIYFPIVILASVCQLVNDVLRWYIELGR